MRIFISFLIILTLPFFIKDKLLKEKDILEQARGYYYNTDYNYSLSYPQSFQPVIDESNQLVLVEENRGAKIVIRPKFGIEDQDIYALYEKRLQPKARNGENPQIKYHIIKSENYAEISYALGQSHYFEQLYHLGNRIIHVQMSVPLTQANWLDDLRKAVRIVPNVNLKS